MKPKRINDPALCEVRSVIRFLLTQNVRASEIHRQLVEVYGENVMNEGNVRKWCRFFKDGRTNVHDEKRIGRPSLVTDELRQAVDKTIKQNSRLSITEIQKLYPVVSRSLMHEIVRELRRHPL